MVTCFMCDRPASTKEHIPPKCFFPNFKDLNKAHRRNLITVRACEEHNLGTSQDDEYLFVIVCTHWLNNTVADDQVRAKVRRTLKHSRGLHRRFFGPGRNGELAINGESLRTAPVDRGRFDSGMQKIARGVYFVHSQRRSKWLGEVYIDTPHLYPILNSATPRETVAEISKQQTELKALGEFVSSTRRYGDNQEIFYYQVWFPEEQDAVDTIDTVIRLVFYEGFDVFAFLVEQPQNPAIRPQLSSTSLNSIEP